MSDLSVRPPLRIAIANASQVSAKAARSNIDAFLSNYELRASGGDSTIRTQLQKMSASMKAERKAHKKQSS